MMYNFMFIKRNDSYHFKIMLIVVDSLHNCSRRSNFSRSRLSKRQTVLIVPNKQSPIEDVRVGVKPVGSLSLNKCLRLHNHYNHNIIDNIASLNSPPINHVTVHCASCNRDCGGGDHRKIYNLKGSQCSPLELVK